MDKKQEQALERRFSKILDNIYHEDDDGILILKADKPNKIAKCICLPKINFERSTMLRWADFNKKVIESGVQEITKDDLEFILTEFEGCVPVALVRKTSFAIDKHIQSWVEL